VLEDVTGQDDIEAIVRHLLQRRWIFEVTYDHSFSRRGGSLRRLRVELDRDHLARMRGERRRGDAARAPQLEDTLALADHADLESTRISEVLHPQLGVVDPGIVVNKGHGLPQLIGS
jgi:hypothetical protein